VCHQGQKSPPLLGRGDLFREVQGHRDDELVPKTEALIHLTEWEHFYSAQGKLNPGSVA